MSVDLEVSQINGFAGELVNARDNYAVDRRKRFPTTSPNV
jgi:hypothetical protein